MATVGSISIKDVVCVTRDSGVVVAARLMRDEHVGTVVVVERVDGAERPIGIITDRDLVVEVLAFDLDAHDLTVGEIMALGQTLVTVNENDHARAALDLMCTHGVRRVPVVDDSGRLVGLVAGDDLAKVLADDLSALAQLPDYERAREAAQRKPVPA